MALRGFFELFGAYLMSSVPAVFPPTNTMYLICDKENGMHQQRCATSAVAIDISKVSEIQYAVLLVNTACYTYFTVA